MTLFQKYALVLGSLVVVVLSIDGVVGAWLYYDEHRSTLVRLQREQAHAAADRIEQFLRGLEKQVGWAVQLPWLGTSLEQRRFDALRLLGQAPAVAELSVLDLRGHEQVRVSRLALDVLRSDLDLSDDARFGQAIATGRYYGPVYFRRGSEPFITLAISGRRRDFGVAIAEINLKFIWDLVSGIAAGAHGTAYLVDGTGRLIAHPDLSSVLRRVEFSHLAQVQTAIRRGSISPRQTFTSQGGQSVVVAYAAVAATNWTMLVEVPVSEVFEPVYKSLRLSAWLLIGTLALSVIVGSYLARQLVVPIRTLKAGAARIAAGDLSHQIVVTTGDELEQLAAEFNDMTQRLERSYAELEAKVQERTRELEEKSRELAIASDHKSRFLAVMSHELRTPLNAIIGLTEAMVDHSEKFGTSRALEPLRRVHRSGMVLLSMINELLDFAKIEAGKIEISREPTQLVPLLCDVAETARPLASKNGNILRLVMAPDLRSANVDPLRLQQILLNVVGNACKFTKDGEVTFSARRLRICADQDALEFVISDTGIGMTSEELATIFDEFSQATPKTVRRFGGTGLGLAIARRLCLLMEGDIIAASELGGGSRFIIRLPVGNEDY